MREAFTTFAVSRFVDREAVRSALRECAQSLRRGQPEIVAVWLFGSFVDGAATPHSDADIIVEISDDAFLHAEEIKSASLEIFLASPVPVDLFVLTTSRIRQGRGLAAALTRASLRLS